MAEWAWVFVLPLSIYTWSCGGLSGPLGVGLKIRPEPQREGKAEPPLLPCCPFSHLQWLLIGYRAAGAACPTDPAQVRERGGSADSCSCLCSHWEAGCQVAVGSLFLLPQVHGHLPAPAFSCWVPFPKEVSPKKVGMTHVRIGRCFPQVLTF